MHLLAIVIPAFKEHFFSKALQSIAAQTNKNFVVYIGDDASPYDLKTISSYWQDSFKLKYHRFDKNLGATDLVAQWERCIDLSSEPWVWLFSDDDEMEPGCVDAFYKAIDSNNSASDIFHFNVNIIDSESKLIREAVIFPPLLPAVDFILKRLRGEISSYAPDYIFSRSAFIKVSRFQKFPRAWCSDDATWIKLAGDVGIKTIHGPKVYWRRSGQNITSNHQNDSFEKIDASFQFLEWISFYLNKRSSYINITITDEIKFAGNKWICGQIIFLNLSFYSVGFYKCAKKLSAINTTNFFGEFYFILKFDIYQILSNCKITIKSIIKKIYYNKFV